MLLVIGWIFNINFATRRVEYNLGNSREVWRELVLTGDLYL